MSQMIVAARLNPKHVPQEVIDRVASDEVRAAKAKARAEAVAEYSAEQERAKMVEISRNRMLAGMDAAIRRKIYRRRNPVARLIARVATVYATMIGMVMSWQEVGETLGLWERVQE